MSDFEGNVHQQGYIEDYEGEGDGEVTYPNYCEACGHTEELHYDDDSCSLCNCFGFRQTAEPEEVEER